MTRRDATNAAARSILFRRLRNQALRQSAFATPGEVVAWHGAVQAQEYAPARWALGLRAPGIGDAAVDEALARGTILRTHVMRPTWHFVAPRDIRWMQELTAPGVRDALAPYDRKLELDGRVFARSHKILERALGQEGDQTREELGGLTYWSVAQRAGRMPEAAPAYLLPIYDEYMNAYKDRDLVVRPTPGLDPARRFVYNHYVVIDGRLAGSWLWTAAGDAVLVTLAPFEPLPRADRDKVEAAAERLGAFLGRRVDLVIGRRKRRIAVSASAL